MSYPEHYDETILLVGSVEEIFDFANDHTNLASHMNTSSMMMAGSKMDTVIDSGKGQKLGSHIQMKGSILGINLYLDEAITEYKPPYRKVWETVGNPKLIVIGNYRLGFELSKAGKRSKLTVFIDYELPKGKSKLLGLMFGRWYAKWCVRQMIDSVSKKFG